MTKKKKLKLSKDDVDRIMKKHIIPWMKGYDFDPETEKAGIDAVRQNLERFIESDLTGEPNEAHR